MCPASDFVQKEFLNFIANISKMANKKQAKSQEQIVAGFQELRQQQRGVASKISELEMDMKEHEYDQLGQKFTVHEIY